MNSLAWSVGRSVGRSVGQSILPSLGRKLLILLVVLLTCQLFWPVRSGCTCTVILQNSVFCALFWNTGWVSIYRLRLPMEKFLNSKQKGLLVKSICNIHLTKFCAWQLAQLWSGNLIFSEHLSIVVVSGCRKPHQNIIDFPLIRILQANWYMCIVLSYEMLSLSIPRNIIQVVAWIFAVYTQVFRQIPRKFKWQVGYSRVHAYQLKPYLFNYFIILWEAQWTNG